MISPELISALASLLTAVAGLASAAAALIGAVRSYRRRSTPTRRHPQA